MKLPDQIGRYRIQRLLGSGGMGRVYLGEHVDTGWIRALKTLRLDDGERGADKRFVREAKAAAELRHPNVVQIYEFGRDDDEGYFYVMEYLRGEDLHSRLDQKGRLEWREVCLFLIQASRGLACAHARGIYHRDIKPANLFIAQAQEGEELKVIDFGIAKVLADLARTATEGVVGTAHYASPEQIEVLPVDARSDIYSLGASAYHLLVGDPPFQGPIVRVLQAHLQTRPEPLRRSAPDAGIPEEVEALVLKCLEKQPGARYQSMAELEAALHRLVGPVDVPAGAGSSRATPRMSAEFADAPTLVKRAGRGHRVPWIAVGTTGVGLVLATFALDRGNAVEADPATPSARPNVDAMGSGTESDPGIASSEPGVSAESRVVSRESSVGGSSPSQDVGGEETMVREGDRGESAKVELKPRPSPATCSKDDWQYVKARIKAGAQRESLGKLPSRLLISYSRNSAGKVTGKLALSDKERELLRGTARMATLEKIIEASFGGCVEPNGARQATITLSFP